MLSVDRPSTECRPITDQHIGQVSTNYRPTIGEVSAKCRRKVGEVSVNEKLYRPRHIWNDYLPCLDRVSTHYRPTIDRYIDRVSTAISTDISVDITHSKQDPIFFLLNYNKVLRPLITNLWLFPPKIILY